MKPGKLKKQSYLIYLIAAFLLLAAGIIAAGYQFYLGEKKEFIRSAKNELSSIAALKVSEISNWRKERGADAAFASTSLAINRYIEDVSAGGGSRYKDAALARMKDLVVYYGYRGVILFDTEGNKLAAVPPEEDITHIGRDLIAETLRAKNVVFSNIHRYGDVGYLHIGISAPVSPLAGGVPRGVLFLRWDVEKYLYPMIRSWPVPSATAETLLVSREGDDVVFLNDLRFREDAALSLRFPAAAAGLPAAMAVRGKKGIVEGVDYRGARVLAAIAGVPDSPWYLVAKKDLAEIIGPIEQEFREVAAIASALVFAVFLAVLLVWQKQNAEAARSEHESRIRSLALEKHYDYLAKYANDPIILADNDLKVTQANDRALSVYGYSREEMLGMPAERLRASEEREAFRKYIRNIGPEGEIVETRHITRDGRVFPAEVSVRRIEVEGNEFYQAVIRDITERKKAEEEAGKALEDWKETFDAVNDLVMLLDKDYRIIKANSAAAMFFNKPLSEIIGDHCYKLMHGTDLPPDFCPIDKMAKSKSHEEIEINLPGTDTWLLVSVDPILDDRKEIASVVHIVKDISERKKAEEELRLSEARYKNIIHTTQDGFWYVDAEGRFLDVNGAACRMLGYERDELLKMKISDIEELEDQEKVIRHIAKMRDAGGDRFETRHRRKDGSLVNTEVVTSFITDDGGKERLFVFVRDITERKLASEELRKLAEVVRHSTELVNLATPDGKMMFLNEAGSGMLGIPSIEVNRHNIMDVIPDDEKGKVENDLLPALRDKGRWEGELKYRNLKTGQETITYAITFAIRDQIDGRVLYYANVSRNITESKRAEEDLKELEASYRAIFDSANDAIFVHDRTGRILNVNRRMCEMFSVSREEALTMNIGDISERKPPYTQEKGAELVRKAFEGEPQLFEWRSRDKHGRIFWVEVNLKRAAIEGEDRVLAIVRDVTERKKAEEELALYKANLEDLVKERTAELESFSYSVSHDLRAPLRAIDGFVRILAEEFAPKLDTEGKRITDVIVENTRNMGRLIDDLLAFSRLGRKEPEVSDIDMTESAKRIGGGIVSGEPGRNIKLSVGELPPARGDRAMIEIALTNLISNSVKFTRKSKKAVIDVTGKEEDGEKVYCVRDNGVGFNMRYVERLFGVFQRLHSAEEFEGTGIGLAIVKRIIAKHGGRVWAEGEAGKGAAFYFALPKK